MFSPTLSPRVSRFHLRRLHYIRVRLSHPCILHSRNRTLLCCACDGHSRAHLASSQPTVYISSPALRPLGTAPASPAQCDLEDLQHISFLIHLNGNVIEFRKTNFPGQFPQTLQNNNQPVVSFETRLECRISFCRISIQSTIVPVSTFLFPY